jgi:chromosome segregation ATPase
MIFRHKIVMVVFVLMAFSLGYGWAQEGPQEDTPMSEKVLLEKEGSAEFKDIRTRIQTLLEENKALEAEHEALRLEFWELQRNVGGQKAEIAEWERKLENTAGPSLNEDGSGEDLRQMQLDNLRYQKKEWELELQSKKILMEALQRQYDEEIARLEQKSTEGLERKKELNRRIQEIEKEAPGYPQEMDRLKRENDYLDGEIEKFEKMIRSHKKEKKSLLKDDYELSTHRLLKETIAEKEREQKALQSQIKELEAKKNVLERKEPPEYGNDLNRLRETARQIEQENQKLRNEILSLRPAGQP